MSPDPWRELAACHPSRRPDDMTPAEWTSLFFPERGARVSPAKSICAGCPVATECRAFAEATPREREGVWGGTTARERRRGRATGRSARRSHPVETRRLALELAGEGVSMREIARTVGADHRTISNWLDQERLFRLTR